MFLPHFAVAFSAKRWAPRASLGILTVAPLLPDLLWPIFLLAGWEQVRIAPGDTAFTPLSFVSYPISHSLLAASGWAAALSLGYWLGTRYRNGSVAIFLGVISHWLLDALAHRPDLPLYPGGPLIGLGLWNSAIATIAVESFSLGAGVWIYLAATRPKDRAGTYGLWAFLLLLAAILAGAAAGPPPPSERAVAVADLAAWLFPLAAWWIDRRRQAK